MPCQRGRDVPQGCAAPRCKRKPQRRQDELEAAKRLAVGVVAALLRGHPHAATRVDDGPAHFGRGLGTQHGTGQQTESKLLHCG